MTTGQVNADQALAQYSACLHKAMECFSAVDLPKWKSTQNGMLCFKGLALDKLPRKLGKRLDRCFGGINNVLSKYPIKTWDDYQLISDADLQEIQRLILNA